MRPILFVTRNYPPATGGIETLASELVAHARHAGNPGTEIILVHIGQRRHRPDPASVPAYYHLPGTHRFTAMLTSMVCLPFLAWRHRPRIIVNVQVTTAFGSWLALKLLRVPYCVMAMGLEVLPSHDAWLRGVKGLSLRGARKVVSISRFTDGLVSQFGIAPERRAVVTPGTRFWPPVASRSKTEIFGPGAESLFVCLSLSRLVPRKGMDTVLAALPRVLEHRRDILYCIAGSGPDLPRLQAIVSRHGLENHVRFLGRVADEDVGAAYGLADLFVLPCRETRDPPAVEGFGIVFLEAAACGTPSLVGKSGGAPDAVRDGETGFLVDPSDPREIAEKILLLMENRALLRSLGEGALAHARESTWEKACLRYFSAFEA